MTGEKPAGLGSQAHPHQALHATHQRQSGAFHQNLLAEWAYFIAYQTSEEHNRWLPRYLEIYNGRRCHMALGGLSPQQCLQRLLIAE